MVSSADTPSQLRNLVTNGDHARFRELAATQLAAVWDAIQHCDAGQLFDCLSPAFAEHASAPSAASRGLVLATLNGLIHPDPAALKSPDRRRAREHEFPPARPPDPRWLEAAVPLFDDPEVGYRATELARCVLASAPEAARGALLDHCARLDGLAAWPRLFNELARSREPRLLERLRAIADSEGAPKSRVCAAAALIHEAGIAAEERDRLVGCILDVLAQTDDAFSIEPAVPVLEEHAREVHREQVATALAHWTTVAKREKATRYEIPISHIVKNALTGIAKDIGAAVPATRRRLPATRRRRR